MIDRLRDLSKIPMVKHHFRNGKETVICLNARRSFRRFQLAVPALFRWKEGEERREVGCCTNIGMGGLFVLSSKYPPLAAEVEVEILLPAFDPAFREVRINCAGRVIRTQESCELVSGGFAVAGKFD